MKSLNKKEIINKLIKDGIIAYEKFIEIRYKICDLDFESINKLDKETIEDWIG